MCRLVNPKSKEQRVPFVTAWTPEFLEAKMDSEKEARPAGTRSKFILKKNHSSYATKYSPIVY